jgi:hypothetical protein
MTFRVTEIPAFAGGMMVVVMTHPWRERNIASLLLTLVV